MKRVGRTRHSESAFIVADDADAAMEGFYDWAHDMWPDVTLVDFQQIKRTHPYVVVAAPKGRTSEHRTP